jgi:protoporphyrin/coproporphyrin ferrochelatase
MSIDDPMIDPTNAARPYDAVLLVSFGGPEKPADVVPFLENVTRGRGIPKERLVEVGQHYFRFGGRSPINDQNREFLAALRADFAAAGLHLPVYWGNRNWAPYLPDAIREMREDGVQRAACFVTSAYSSYSGCRQYRENLATAVAEVADEVRIGARMPRLDRLRHYFNHPGFLEPVVDATLSSLSQLSRPPTQAHVLFVTHSIPTTMNATSGPRGNGYLTQHESGMREVMTRVEQNTGAALEHELVFCSRSGPPNVPWLEPDVNDRIEQLAAAGTRQIVLVPIGFVSDHMEVIYDLDTEALATAEKHGIEAVRAPTPGADPRFVAMVRELVLERAQAERGEAPNRVTWGEEEANPDRCGIGCCPNPRAALPTLGGLDELVAQSLPEPGSPDLDRPSR